MSTNLGIFPDPSSGKSSRQENFEDLYVSNGIDFVPLLYDAHQKTLDDASREAPEFINRSYFAQNMNRNLVGLIKQRYPDVVKYDEEARVYVNLGPRARLYFKKLDKKFRPNNIPTRHVIDLNSAQGLLFGRDLAVLYIGPRLKQDGVWDQLGFYMVEMRSTRRCEWVSDLFDLSARMGRFTGPVPTAPQPSTPPVPVTAKLKRKQSDDSDREQAASN